MNASIIFLIGAIGLTGCTAMGQHRGGDGRDAGFSSAYSGKSEEPYPSDKPVKRGDPYVRQLPREAEVALAKVGIKDMAFLAAVDRHGEVRLLKPDNVKWERFQLPQTLKIQEFRQLLLMSFNGSDCWALIDGKYVKGSWLDPHSEGGIMIDRFCKIE